MSKLGRFWKVWTLALAVLTVLTVEPAAALITGLAPAPASVAVPAGGTLTVPLAWNMNTDLSGAVTITSPQGEFLAGSGGPVLGTVGVGLSRQVAGPAAASISENLTIPASVVNQALQLGQTSLLYRRAFADGRQSTTGELAIAISLPPPPQVSSLPAVAPVVLGRSGSTTLRWNITTGYAGAAQLSSARGTFRAGLRGPVLATVETALSRGVAGAGSYQLAETVNVTAGLLEQAQRMGATQLVYERSFDDGFATVDGRIVLQMVGSAGGGFELHRLELNLGEYGVTGLVARGAALRSQAEILFSGAGLLSGRWEVATPETTRGQPVFRTLGLVREPLAAGGRVRLLSPELPTDTVGLYLVRLRVDDPAVDFELPVLRYFVSERGEADEGTGLDLLSPPPRALLAADTRFRWKPVAGARAYQLEFYPGGTETRLPSLGPDGGAGTVLPERPLTGLLLPAERQETGLSSLVYQYLEPGRAYRWRVVAIGQDGRVLARSGLQELRLP